MTTTWHETPRPMQQKILGSLRQVAARARIRALDYHQGQGSHATRTVWRVDGREQTRSMFREVAPERTRKIGASTALAQMDAAVAALAALGADDIVRTFNQDEKVQIVRFWSEH